MSRHGLADIDMTHAVWSLLAQLAGQHVEGFGAWMRVHRRPGPGRPTRIVDAQQILRRSNWGHGPDLDNLASLARPAAPRTKLETPDLARGVSSHRPWPRGPL